MTIHDHIAAIGAARKLIFTAISELEKIETDDDGDALSDARYSFNQGFEYIDRYAEENHENI